jgi:hypothetical protein
MQDEEELELMEEFRKLADEHYRESQALEWENSQPDSAR